MKADIANVREEEDYLIVTISNHPFRKSGGGQPCDKGIILDNDFEAEVIDVISGDELKVIAKKGTVKSGPVMCEIDEARRSRLTKMHTGEHILFKSLEKYVKGLKLEKIRLEEDESVIHVTADMILWNHAFAAERLANQIIRDNLAISEKHVPKSEITEGFPGLRVKLDRIKDETVRVMLIGEFDKSACTGTHCKSTGEVGNLIITSLNSSGTGKYEIRFMVNAIDQLFFLAEKARLALSILGTEPDKLESTLSNLKDNLEKYKNLARKQKVDISQEKVGDTSFHYAILEDADKKQMTDQAKVLLKEKTLVCFINLTEKGAQMLLMSSGEADASEIVNKISEKYGGRGGGKKEFAMCSFDESHVKDVLDDVREIIHQTQKPY